jgi:preprotein translocase subunit SecG
MRNIIRFYNENRLTFWIIVLIIIFIIFLLHFFNGLAREDSKRKIEASKTSEETNTTQASINKEKKKQPNQ